MKSISERKLIRRGKKSSFPDFRQPEVNISGRDFFRTAQQVFARQIIENEDLRAEVSQIGVPSELQKVDERIIKKGPSTFIDVFIEFDPAPGAEYHEFRVSKIALDEQENGE
jgi:hypothetical protein